MYITHMNCNSWTLYVVEKNTGGFIIIMKESDILSYFVCFVKMWEMTDFNSDNTLLTHVSHVCRHVLNELIETEMSYVQQLQSIWRVS